MDVRFESTLREVAELPEGQEITGSQKLNEDLGVDSLALIDIVVQLEGEFAVELSEDKLADVTTVEQLWAVVDQAVAA